MKKLLLLCLVLMCVLSFCGCSKIAGAQSSDDAEQEENEIIDNRTPPTVQIDGVRYYCYSEEAAAPDEEDIAGTIKSYIDNVADEIYMEDDQSNFPACVGQPYAFVDGELRLYFSTTEKWYKCIPEEEALNEE